MCKFFDRHYCISYSHALLRKFRRKVDQNLLKNIKNSIFLDDKNVSLVINHDDCHTNDYENSYENDNVQNTAAEKTTFTTHNSTDKQPPSTLQLRKTVKWDKLADLGIGG